MIELLKSAISEIDYALVSNKGGKEVREHYLNNAKRFINEAEKEQQIQLNENQQIVLDWMKRDLTNLGVDSLLCELTFLSCTGGWMKNTVTARAYRNLTDIERLQVLQAFAEWGLSDK